MADQSAQDIVVRTEELELGDAIILHGKAGSTVKKKGDMEKHHFA